MKLYYNIINKLRCNKYYYGVNLYYEFFIINIYKHKKKDQIYNDGNIVNN